MCVAISNIVDIASTAIELTTGLYSLNTDKAIGKYNEKQLIEQAKSAERNAAYERQEGIENARRERLKAIQNMGRQTADIAAGNIMTSSSSALSLIGNEKINGELDAINIINSSERKSKLYLESADNYYKQSGLQSFKTKRNYVQGIYDVTSEMASKAAGMMI